MWWAHGGAREGKWRWKLANAVGSQYPSHYLGTRCIQHYYRWRRTPRDASSRLNWRPANRADLNGLVRFARKTKSGFCACVVTFKWTRSVSRERRNLVSAHVLSHLKGLVQLRAKDEIWFLRMCCHISTGLYCWQLQTLGVMASCALRRAENLAPCVCQDIAVGKPFGRFWLIVRGEIFRLFRVTNLKHGEIFLNLLVGHTFSETYSNPLSASSASFFSRIRQIHKIYKN
jgi:hypothetical protein